MYKSSMRVSELLTLAEGAADVAPQIDRSYYLLWLNSLESLVYTGILRECGVAVCTVVDGRVDVSEIEPGSDAAPPRAGDVRCVFSDGRELIRTCPGEFPRHPERPAFCADGDKLRLQSPDGLAGKVTVVYLRRPKAKTEQSLSAYVALPDEFLPMALDYLVGCAYALVCEDNQAANRMAAYNAAMDDFVRWHEKNEGGKE